MVVDLERLRFAQNFSFSHIIFSQNAVAESRFNAITLAAMIPEQDGADPRTCGEKFNFVEKINQILRIS